MKQVQFTIDSETSRRIESLARPRAGNKSFVVREAVRRMAQEEGFEGYPDCLDQQPGVRMSLERGLSDVQAGRTVPHKQVLRRARRPARR